MEKVKAHVIIQKLENGGCSKGSSENRDEDSFRPNGRAANRKNAEVPKGHPERTFKGRCVRLGTMVKDEKFEAAVHAEVASAPAALEAARAIEHIAA